MKNTDKLIAEAIDHLTYSSYVHNRELSPEIEPTPLGINLRRGKSQFDGKNIRKVIDSQAKINIL